MKYLNTYNQLNEDSNQLNEYNKIVEEQKKLKLRIEVEDIVFDADDFSGFDLIMDYVYDNNLPYKNIDVSEMPRKMSAEDLSGFLKYYKIQTKVKDFNL